MGRVHIFQLRMRCSGHSLCPDVHFDSDVPAGGGGANRHRGMRRDLGIIFRETPASHTGEDARHRSCMCGGVLCQDVQHQLGLLIQISRGEAAVPDRIDLTETLVLLGILCGILLFWLIFIVRKAWIFYFFSIPIVFGGPLLGQVLDVTEICLFAFFHMGTSVMGSIASDRRQPSPNVPGSSQTAAAGRCVALLGVFSMVFLLTAQLFTAKQMERLLAIPAKAEGYVRQTVSEMFVDSERNGDISRSNSYPSGKGQMELVLTAKPEENLYLKGFTGSAYVNGSWNSADETQFLEAAARESGQDPGELRDRFENRKYYPMQSATGGQGQTLSVQYVNQNETKTYLPPVSRLQEHSDTGYKVQMYEEQEFEDTISGMQAEAWPEYLMLEDRYRQYAAETYLEVPDDGFSRLKTLCDEHPMTNYEGITEFILGRFTPQPRTPLHRESHRTDRIRWSIFCWKRAADTASILPQRLC